MFLWRHAGWGIGILVAALIGPAIGKQWSDRNQELSLKNDLVAGLSTSVATALTRADEIARQGGSAVDRQDALDAWVRTQSSLTGSFVVYFPGGAVHRSWSNTLKKPHAYNWIGFRDAVYDYIELSCCGSRPERDVEDISRLLAAFGFRMSADARTALADRAPAAREDFLVRFHQLGLELFDLRNTILQQLATAHAQGFSSGWGDFMHDLSHPIG